MHTAREEVQQPPVPTDSIDHIDQLEGNIHEQYVRCGKLGCRCLDGNLHGPYYYRIWREGARVRKVYVKSEEIEAIRAACETRKAYMELLRSHRQKRRELQRKINQEWRTAKGLVGTA